MISEDSLHILGLSQFHFYIILITLAIVLLGLAIVGLCNCYGAFNDVGFWKQKLRACRIVYFNHQGPYENLGDTFSKANNVFNKFFKISKMFAIYYDDPKHMEDKNSCRSTIGIIINEGELHKCDSFFASHPALATTMLPTTACLTTTFPYINTLSFLFIVAKVYPKLETYLKSRQIQSAPAIMEIYHFLSDSGNSVQILAPLQNFGAFMLWEDSDNLIPVRGHLRKNL